MLTLILFRHGKSSWADNELRDYDRPLASRGRQAVPRMAQFMVSEGHIPERVICSGATRTRQTLELLEPGLSLRPEQITFDDVIYDALPSQLVARIRREDPDASPLMIVGHNPGLEELAIGLLAYDARPVDDEEVVLRRALESKFPTAALAVIRCDIARWSELGPGRGRLVCYQVPRQLS